MNWAQRAHALVGSPYRVGGRDRTTGLDCLGLVIDVFDLPQIASRGRSDEEVYRLLDLHFQKVGHVRSGDLIVMRRGQRWHFGVRCEDGVIHADIRARTVLWRRGPLPWPLFGIYRRISWRH